MHLHVLVVVDYADTVLALSLTTRKRAEIVTDYAYTRFSNFAIEYLRENEKVRKTVFACSCGAPVKSFKHKNNVRNLVTLSL